MRMIFLRCCCCYHVTIVAIGHGLLKKFGLFGNRLRSTHCREFLYMKQCRPAYFNRTTQLLPYPGHEQRQVCILFHSTKCPHQRQYFPYVGCWFPLSIVCQSESVESREMLWGSFIIYLKYTWDELRMGQKRKHAWLHISQTGGLMPAYRAGFVRFPSALITPYITNCCQLWNGSFSYNIFSSLYKLILCK